MNAIDRSDEARHQSGPIGPLNFVSKTLERYFWAWILAWLAIPSVFFAIKSFHLFAPANLLSEKLKNFLSAMWPLFAEQSEQIIIVASVGEATNFTWFFVAMMLFNLVVVVFLLLSYLRNLHSIQSPSTREILALILCAAAALYIAKFDKVLEHPKPLWDFFVDPSGLYYFRQAMLLHIFYFSVAAAIIAVLAGIRGIVSALTR